MSALKLLSLDNNFKKNMVMPLPILNTGLTRLRQALKIPIKSIETTEPIINQWRWPEHQIINWSLNELNINFGSLYKKVFLVNGDTGAHNYLPSTSCIEDGNILNIANGIGGKNTDEILILENESIARISIN